jgi:hypothetical protein
LCARRQRADIREICERCARDHIELVKLYNEIVRRRPELRIRTVPEVFRILANKALRKG